MTKQILTVFTASLMLVSCTKDKTYEPPDIGPGDPAYINLILKGAVSQKAIDETSEDDDQLINDMIVFVVRDDGNTFDIQPQFISGSALTPGTNNQILPQIIATTKANEIYIVTNTGSYDNGIFNSCVDMSAVRQVAMRLDGNPNTGSNCKYKNVWMAGEAKTLTNDGFALDGIAQKKADIQLEYLAAKVFIITENHMINYNDPDIDGRTLLEGVAMINAGAYTGFVKNAAGTYEVARSTAYPQVPFYYNGISIKAFPANYKDVPPLYNTSQDFSTVTAMSNQIGFGAWAANSSTHTTKTLLEDKDAFYLFPPRTDGNQKVWATIYGLYNAEGLNTTAKKDAADQAFWSAGFGISDGKITEPLKSGNKYILTIELAGSANTGNNHQIDPTIESISQYLNITVNAAEWIVSSPKKTIY